MNRAPRVARPRGVLFKSQQTTDFSLSPIGLMAGGVFSRIAGRLEGGRVKGELEARFVFSQDARQDCSVVEFCLALIEPSKWKRRFISCSKPEHHKFIEHRCSSRQQTCFRFSGLLNGMSVLPAIGRPYVVTFVGYVFVGMVDAHDTDANWAAAGLLKMFNLTR